MVFDTEKEMVETITESKCLFDLMISGNYIMKMEMSGFSGIPDIVCVERDQKKQVSYAYEAKLSNWSRALTQAFRYKSFVNKSFVILDHDRIEPALRNVDKFCKANVGLIDVEKSGKIHSYYTPYFEEPYSQYLVEKFNSYIANETFCPF